MPICEPTWVGNPPNPFPLSLNGNTVRKFTSVLAIILTCLVALFLTSCSGLSIVTLPDPETSQEYNGAFIATASKDQTIGQTFLARRPRLNGLTLWVKTTSQTGMLQVELYHSPDDKSPIFTQVIPFDQIVNGGLYIRLPTNLPPATSGASQSSAFGVSSGSTLPSGQPYYLVLRPLSGALQVRGRGEDIYPYGQAFSGQSPLEADLAFSATYDYDLTALLGDLRASLPRVWLVLPLMAILFLPGWLLLEGSGLGRRFDGGERIGLSVGLSLALIPLAMLWSTTVGLRWGRTGLLITAALLVAAALWQASRRLFSRKPAPSLTASKIQQSPDNNETASTGKHRRSVPGMIFVLPGIFLLSLGVRLVMSRDLAAPAWVDSIHHATLTRLILEHGGFPSTYAPYIEIDATEYHAGFHSILASFQWLSGLEIPDAMLLFGQVLNALIVFAVYLLTVTVTRQRAAGVVAALIAGLFTPMPAYYTSWGRYTQLAGLLILPAGLALARLFIEGRDAKIDRDENNSRDAKFYVPTKDCIIIIVASAITCGGLSLVHYRVAGFLGLLFIAYFASQLRFSRLENVRLAKRMVIFCLSAGLLALLITLPWSWRAITHVFLPKAGIEAGSSARAFEGFFWEYLTAAWGLPAMLLAGLGLAISLFRRRSLAVCMTLWTGLLLLAGNLSALHLPGSWFVNTISVAITLFLPTAVLAGYGLGQIYEILHSLLPLPWKAVLRGTVALLGVVIALLASRALLPILRTSTELFRQADRPAMAWIAENIPADETILINPMYWGYNTYAGADGGYWITPLTGRKTIPPPVLYALGSPLEKQRIQTMCQAIMDEADNAPGLAKYLRDHEIHYVYLGARGGVISPHALAVSDQFQMLYAQQGVWIFKVR